MSPPVVRRTQAKRDIAQIACFIADENPAAAERFLEAVEASFAALARMPHMGVPRHFRNPKFADVRMWRVRDFDKYLIFYRPRKNGVEILRLVHGARNIEALFPVRYGAPLGTGQKQK